MAASSEARKVIVLIGDGMADRPHPALGGKTPIEAAHTPHMDRLATEGETGLMDLIAPGVRVGSDTGHLALLGYDPYAVYTGRGPFEALGVGMEVRVGDIAFRCNFSTVDDNMVVLDRRAGRITEGTDQLAAQVNGIFIEDVQVFFKESVAHRGALILRGPGLSPKITDADPHAEGEKVHEVQAIDPDDAAARRTARIVNQFVRLSYEKLNHHPVNQKRREQGLNPANIILPRGAGVAPSIPDFNTHHQLIGACVAETGLIKGIARFVGLKVLEVPEATGGLDSDVMAMGRKVVEALQEHTFVLCNVKGPDVAAHDHNPQAKVDIIQRIDAMLGWLLTQIDPATTYIVVSADHTTACSFGDHTGEPVPIVLWGPEVRTDDVTQFGERACARGGLGRIRGKDLVPMLTSLMNVQEKFGA